MPKATPSSRPQQTTGEAIVQSGIARLNGMCLSAGVATRSRVGMGVSSATHLGCGNGSRGQRDHIVLDVVGKGAPSLQLFARVYLRPSAGPRIIRVRQRTSEDDTMPLTSISDQT